MFVGASGIQSCILLPRAGRSQAPFPAVGAAERERVLFEIKRTVDAVCKMLTEARSQG